MPQSNGSVVIENMMKAMPIAARRNATSRPASSPTRDRGTTPSTLNSKNGGPSARTCTSVIASISGRRNSRKGRYSSGLMPARLQMMAMITSGITQGCGTRNVAIRKHTRKTSLVRGSRRCTNESPAENW